MIYIRKGVFETNSSSSHSIVMMKEGKPLKTVADSNMVDADWHVNKDGVMDFWLEDDLEFGRSPFDMLTDWYGRLRYCIATYGDQKDKLREIEEICQRRISGFVKFKFKEDRWENGYYHGYIDHQSLGLLDAALEKYNIGLEEFIFDNKYIVVVDGDEYCLFNTLMDTALFNKEAVDKIVSADYDIEEEYYRRHNGAEEE